VLAWEVMSFGQTPYHVWNDDRVATAVTSGAVLPCPSVRALTVMHKIGLCFHTTYSMIGVLFKLPWLKIRKRFLLKTYSLSETDSANLILSEP